MEWTNISTILVPYEDYILILAPVFLFLFIYIYLKNKQRKILVKRKRMESFYKDLLIHDVKNIFQIIENSYELADILSQKGENLNEIKEFLSNINEQVIRGKILTSNVYNLSRLDDETILLKKVDVCTFLRRSIDFIKNSFKNKHLKIKVNQSFISYHIIANELLLDVFENILLNSIKHNENEIIEIKINIFEKEVNTKKLLVLEFIDNGVGIPDKRKDLIFQKQSKNNEKGMGLGLSLVKKIIDNFNGEISVEDRVKGDYSKGTKFIIEMPIEKN
jgi:signal transduction histidine kinase